MTVREELSHWVVHFIIIGCSSLADEAVVAGVPQILTTASLGQSMMTNRINCLCTKINVIVISFIQYIFLFRKSLNHSIN